MSDKSTYMANAVIDHFLRGESVTSPGTIYLALYTDGGTEVSEADYERQEISLGAPSDGEATNDSLIEFPVAESNWGNVTYGWIYDSLNDGEALMDAEFNKSKEIEEQDQFILREGDVTIKEE